MSRRKARELALQILFHIDVGKAEPAAAAAEAFEREHPPEAVRRFAAALVAGTVSHLEEIDAALSALARDWSLSRMANVDRNILRLGAFEVLFGNDAPPGVAVNEAVELAKLYSTADSGKFVNGVLGTLLKGARPPGVEATAGPAVRGQGDGQG